MSSIDIVNFFKDFLNWKKINRLENENKWRYALLVYQELESLIFVNKKSLVECIAYDDSKFGFTLKRELKESEFDDLKRDIESIFGRYSELGYDIDVFSKQLRIEGFWGFYAYFDKIIIVQQNHQLRNKLVEEYADESDIFK